MHDSEVQVVEVGDFGVGDYRILVDASGFTNHYLAEIIRQNNRGMRMPVKIPLAQGYIYFDSPDFLQGMFTLTNTIGVAAPWLALDTRENDTWVRANITFP